MRQPQNAKRGRGRGRRGNGGGQPHVPNRNTSYESNGPDVKLRGNAQQLYEKYTALAHDASSSGERISAEAYSQFADHYFRLHQAAVGAAEARRQNDAPSEQSGQQRNKPQAESADTGDSQPEIAGEADKAEGDAGTDTPVKDDSATDDSGDSAKGDSAKDDAEVVKLSPAELAEAVQEEQDSASA